MFIDLTLSELSKYSQELGFDNIIKINIEKVKNSKELQKLISQNILPLIIEASDDDELNRIVFENKKVDIIFHLEDKRKPYDPTHFRNSGLNQVLCKLANKNNIHIGFSLDEILKSKNQSLLIGRIKQNIKLCRKYKVKMVFASLAKDKYGLRLSKDLISLMKVLGMTPGEAKHALEYASELFKK